MNLEAEAKAVAQLSTQLDMLSQSVKREEKQLEQATQVLFHTQTAQEILQLIAQAVQQQVHKRISEVVSSCLSAVFDDPYEFKIEFERKRGRTEARLRFLRRGLDIDPLTASGGGAVDVAAFALRVACLIMHRPRLSRVVILDEPFKFLSAEYRGNIRGMLEQLSKDMKMQIVMVTHIQEFEIGKVISL